MSNFVELENGSLINLDHVVKVHPRAGSNRIDFITGAHLQLTDTEMEKVKEATKPSKSFSQTRMHHSVPTEGYSVGPNGESKPADVAIRVNEEKPKKRRGRPPKNKSQG